MKARMKTCRAVGTRTLRRKITATRKNSSAPVISPMGMWVSKACGGSVKPIRTSMA